METILSQAAPEAKRAEVFDFTAQHLFVIKPHNMHVTKLSWSGVKIEVNNTTLLIDAVEDFSSVEAYMGKPTAPVYSFSRQTKADLALVTHLHADHFDRAALQTVLQPGGCLLLGRQAADKLKPVPFATKALNIGESWEHKGIRCTALFSMDGIGEEQVAWMVEANGATIFHAGDTIWHNQFWAIGKSYGPFDLAFLPINGVRVNYPFVGYTPLPAALLPEQAAVAGRILKAKAVVPMHYNLFHAPPVYTQYLMPEQNFVAACKKHQQPYLLLNDGDRYCVPAREAARA